LTAKNYLSDVRKLIHHRAQQNITRTQFADVADYCLMTKIKNCCNTHNIKITETVSPNFLNTLDGVKPFFDKKKTYFQTAFYIEQRK
jgi:deoxyribodipyrimidine photolyase-related protein